MTVIYKIDLTAARPPDPDRERGGAPPRRHAPRGSLRLLVRVGLFLAAVAALILAWTVGSHHFASYILPGPGPVWHAFRSDWDRGVWASDVQATLSHLFIAYGLTIALGLPIGILIGRFWVVADLTRAFLIFLKP